MTGLALACNSFPEHAGNLEALTNRATALRCPSALGLAGARRLPLTSWHEAGTFRLCSEDALSLHLNCFLLLAVAAINQLHLLN